MVGGEDGFGALEGDSRYTEPLVLLKKNERMVCTKRASETENRSIPDGDELETACCVV